MSHYDRPVKKKEKRQDNDKDNDKDKDTDKVQTYAISLKSW